MVTMQHTRNLSRMFTAAVFVLMLAVTGCSDDGVQPVSPDASSAFAVEGSAVPFFKEHPGLHPGLRRAMEVQNRNTERFLEKKGVVGVGTGLTEDGEPAIVVFTEEALGNGHLPARLDGIPVIERVAGGIMASGKGGKSGSKSSKSTGPSNTTTPSTTARLPRPVPIGTSTSNWYDCGAGTIGVRVKNGENYYILSCNHVFARLNAASAGERILQPGRSDAGCAQSANDEIGQLSDMEYITYGSSSANIMDAALVRTSTSLVSNATPQDGYGQPSSTTKMAYLGMEVQKYGRTTGLTTGKVCAINTALTVPYPAGPAIFRNQIVVEPLRKNKPFADGGDSGSLIVTNDTNANPIGLLYAKSSNFVYVAPIDPILTRFNVQIDGK